VDWGRKAVTTAAAAVVVRIDRDGKDECG